MRRAQLLAVLPAHRRGEARVVHADLALWGVTSNRRSAKPAGQVVAKGGRIQAAVVPGRGVVIGAVRDVVQDLVPRPRVDVRSVRGDGSVQSLRQHPGVTGAVV